LAYRLIPPGYELWDEMGIYQRNLTNFDETPIIENTSTKKNCVNCHSFCMQDPDKMLLHMREKVAGTIMITDGKAEKLNTKTDQTVSALVYPSWHPSGKYVAFSTNTTNQAFHVNDRNRIEVYDTESDVVVYDVNKKEIITTEALFSKNAFETFPTFSPDGKTLYFCTAVADTMPIKYRSIKYNLCSISFDPDNRTFGNEVDTLFNAAAIDKTISFPRVSPDGRFLMFTLFDYGNFSIWHKEADLYIMDLMSGEIKPLDAVNSDDTESYHSWSSNSRWFVFSSRRHDGLYTHPYIAHIDEKGNVSKPFMLPQKDAEFYFKFMKSFNIPEMVKGKVKKSPREIALTAKDTPGTNLKFVRK
jgi:Tol biopolymer transport system component